MLIDYKTGGCPSPKQWEGPRPDDPQLPSYAVAAPEELAAVAFAKAEARRDEVHGLRTSAAALLPNVQHYHEWQELLESGRKTPKRSARPSPPATRTSIRRRIYKTCRRCELQTLCRVYEK